MQGTNLYLIVFIVAVLLLPEDEKVEPRGLYVLGMIAVFILVIAFSGGGTMLLKALEG
jgi:hypothetical protein